MKEWITFGRVWRMMLFGSSATKTQSALVMSRSIGSPEIRRGTTGAGSSFRPPRSSFTFLTLEVMVGKRRCVNFFGRVREGKILLYRGWSSKMVPTTVKQLEDTIYYQIYWRRVQSV